MYHQKVYKLGDKKKIKIIIDRIKLSKLFLDLFRKATIPLDYQNHSIWYSNVFS